MRLNPLDLLRRAWHFAGAHLPWNRALPEVAAERRAVCQACPHRDPEGDLLFRTVSGRPVCGRPADPRAPNSLLDRDDEIDGCGCWLDLKWKTRGERCPLGRWPR